MQEPLRIAFRNMEAPIGAEDQVRARVAELERFLDRIIACGVVVEARHRRHHQGNLYHVRIDLIVPDREIVVAIRQKIMPMRTCTSRSAMPLTQPSASFKTMPVKCEATSRRMLRRRLGPSSASSQITAS